MTEPDQSCRNFHRRNALLKQKSWSPPSFTADGKMTGPDQSGRNLHRPNALLKQKSWSPDILREEAWINRRKNNRLRRNQSITDDDLEELRACFELGFQFDSPDLDPKLYSTFPALELYSAVNRSYDSLSRTSSTTFSDLDAATCDSPTSIIDPDEDPETRKTKLKQWAQVVACSVQQRSYDSLSRTTSTMFSDLDAETRDSPPSIIDPDEDPERAKAS